MIEEYKETVLHELENGGGEEEVEQIINISFFRVNSFLFIFIFLQVGY